MLGKTLYTITFEPDGPVVTRGTPPPGFLSGCRDIARLYGVQAGQVRCVRTAAGHRLRFSSNVPERCRQPLRNVWEPPPTGGGNGGTRARG
ncbi:DUF3634 family protein [Arhodomonas aquaeolei]|uniref:DUF3634 family protein n=1 Tax=Arhodomonas aquaeolei TaxID=2369 RepID=UPI0003747CD7|nr:DUF3634 family protein [Arhodomonas aquaeolei]MCS4502527.1 DUF3634 family protein [Arhodomonas aquaeolei]